MLFFFGGKVRKLETETVIRVLVSGIVFLVIYNTTLSNLYIYVYVCAYIHIRTYIQTYTHTFT